MKKLVLLGALALAPILVQAQYSNFPTVIPFGGVPSGSCAPTQLAVNTTNGNLYTCNAGSWAIVSTTIAPLTIVDANTIAQSNTTNAQTFLVYGTVDNVASPTNYERINLTYNSGQSRFRLAAEKGGTGTLRSWDFVGGGAYGFFDSGGNRGFNINANVITQYNNVATVGLGIVPIRGTLLASTAQTASLGATTILTGGAATAGFYRVCYQASTTTSGTGTTGTVTIAWNDGNAKSFTTGTWALNAVDATGQVNGCQVFRIAASQNITVATTIGSIGTSVYRVDAQVEQLQ